MMRCNRIPNIPPLRALFTLALVCALGIPVQAQDRFDWQSLAGLKAGDKILASLRTGHLEGPFQNWTFEQVTIGTMTASKQNVLKIERYRSGAWGRGKKAAAGAAIGLAGGFILGAAAGGTCSRPSLGPCFSRAQTGTFVGLSFAMIGAGIGAVLPAHTKELIYAVK